MSGENKAVGCALVTYGVLALAWLGLLAWALISVVSWLSSK